MPRSARRSYQIVYHDLLDPARGLEDDEDEEDPLGDLMRIENLHEPIPALLQIGDTVAFASIWSTFTDGTLVALHDWLSDAPTHLPFRAGDQVRIRGVVCCGEMWLRAEREGRRGLVPSVVVEWVSEGVTVGLEYGRETVAGWERGRARPLWRLG